MPIEFISTSSFGSGTLRTISLSNSDLHLLAGVTLGSTNGDAIIVNANDVSIHIDGTLAAAFRAIDAGFVSDVRVVVARTGVINSANNQSADVCVFLGSNGDLINQGLISSPESISVIFSSVNSEAFNSGTIAGTTGIQFQSSGGRLINQGNIVASGSIDGNLDVFEAAGVVVEGADCHIFNGANGGISSTAPGGTGVRLSSFAGGSVVENHGEIIAMAGIGVDFAGMLGTESATLRNIGVITGDTIAFDGNETGDTVTNSGVMVGDVLLNDGADLYRARGAGRVDGAISGGAGNDTLRGADADDSLAGDADSDLVSGGSNDDTLAGGSGADTLSGNRDDDMLFGGSENDRLFGGIGDDRLFGETEADRLEGDGGQDSIDGGDGADVLLGGSGDDTLLGRAGVDDLFGGKADDDFVFRSVAEIGTGIGAQDIVRDFEVGRDVIDLSTIDANTLVAGNQVFTFIGAEVFGDIAGQLRYTAATGQLRGDVNGDGVADFALLVSNRAVLTVVDFVL